MNQFFGNFQSFCEKHRPQQKSTVFRKEGSGRENMCGVCLDDVEEEASHDVLWAPCCGGWLHKPCVENMAESAGLAFFKCPLCNNRDEFTEEMMKFGVYIPDQDATWEKGNAFQDLYQR